MQNSLNNMNTMTQLPALVSPTNDPHKTKRNLILACVITLFFKAHSTSPIALPKTVKITTVTDALWAHILTHGLFISCDLFATISLILFLSYICPTVLANLTVQIKEKEAELYKTLDEHPDLHGIQHSNFIWKETQKKEKGFAEYLRAYMKEKQIRPVEISTLFPTALSSYVINFLFKTLPQKFPSILAVFTIIVTWENICDLFKKLL